MNSIRRELNGIFIPSLILGATALGYRLSSKFPILQKVVAIAGTIATAAVILKNYRSPTPTPKPVAPISSERSTTEDQRKLEGLKNHLPPEEAQTIQNYINANIKKWKQDNSFVFIHASENAGLPRSIQYDPNTQSVFVHLNRKKRGDKKLDVNSYNTIATQTIQYETGKVFTRMVFTNRFTDDSRDLQKELRVLNTLNFLPGLIQTINIAKYPQSLTKNPDKTTFKVAIIQEKMDCSLEPFIGGDKVLTADQRKDIARGILDGLKNMHDKSISSENFHESSIFVSIDPESQKAVAKITTGDEELIENATPLQKNADIKFAGFILEALFQKKNATEAMIRLINDLKEMTISSEEAVQRFSQIESLPTILSTHST